MSLSLTNGYVSVLLNHKHTKWLSAASMQDSKKKVILKLRTNDVAKLSLPDFHLQMTNGSYLENANGRSLELMDGGGLQTMSLMRLAQYQSRRL